MADRYGKLDDRVTCARADRLPPRPGTYTARATAMTSRIPVEPQPNSLEELARVASDAVHEAERLVRAELALAKAEFYQELRKGAVAVSALAGALLLLQCALLLWAAALVLWLGMSGWAAAGVGVAFAVTAGLLALGGMTLLRRGHLERTRARLHSDARSLKESSHG